MHRVRAVENRPGFQLVVEFEDGVKGEVDLSERLFGSMFEPLQDAAFFALVRTGEFGVICWPNGADLAPDALYARLAKAGSTAA
jgi:Protein of unknown function (DUF2442)